MTHDPHEGMSPSARALLKHAGAPRPRSAAERARTTQRIGRLAAAPVAVGGAWLSWKGAALAAALVAGAVGVGVARRQTEPTRRAPVAAVVAPTAPTSPVAPAATTSPARQAQATLAAPAAMPRAPAQRAAARAARGAAAPAPRVAAAAPTPAPQEAAVARGAGGGGGGAAAPPAEEDELHAMERARSLLRNDPAEALRVAEATTSGALAEEREMIAVEALHRLGRAEATRARAAGFLARWPRSLYAERVRRRAAP